HIVVARSMLTPQDIGVISGVFKADPDVSYTELSRLQGIAVDAALKVPEVADVIAVAGTGTVNQTPNLAALTVVLVAHEARRRKAAEIAAEIESSLAEIPGMLPFAKPWQDLLFALP